MFRPNYSTVIPPTMPIPVVVGAAQIVGAGAVGREEDVFRVAWLHQHLGALAIQDVGVVDVAVAKNVGAVNS